MMLNRLSWSLETNSQLSSIWCDLRYGRSTLNYLVGFDRDIREAITTKHLLALSLDLQNAFDRVNTELIISRLHSLGYKANILDFMHNLLNNRSFRVFSGEFLFSTYPLNHGDPQDTVMSPTLILIAMCCTC
ncbi:uncharacterized protein LOC143200225 [Rhynchophorus ferrugineus]|uniref:uncharacterized protein LOC143200225 n=1 Tax=Rhynchophorus ferrugineus TaxID=354439 RepID=UPI003FCC8CD4